MSKINIIINNIISNIEGGQDVSSMIEKFPLQIMTRIQSETFLSLLLKKCNQMKSEKQIVKNIMDIFERKRTHDPLPQLTMLLLNNHIEREVLLYTYSCFDNKKVVDYYVDLINGRDDEECCKCAHLLSTLFTITREEWSFLYKLTDNVEEEEYENKQLRQFFYDKLSSKVKINKPNWVKDIVKINNVKEIPKIPSVKEAVDMLIKDLSKNGFEIKEDLRDNLICIYSISTIKEKIKLLNHIQKIEIYDDDLLFQNDGPINSIYSESGDLNNDDDHPRMFNCINFETMTPEGEDIDMMATEEQYITDWYRGYCDKCMKKIPYKHWSLRQPLLNGGWKGCYCSFECIPIKDKRMEITINMMKEQIETIGIRNR